MNDPITGYTPMKVRCVECRKISRDPRVGPSGFCCAHCLTRAHFRVFFTEALDVFECAVSNGYTRESALQKASKTLCDSWAAHSAPLSGTKAPEVKL